MAGILVASIATWYFTRDTLPSTIRIATAQEGGLYHRFASILTPYLVERTGGEIRLIATAGSVDNRERLLAGDADMAILQAGTVSSDGLVALAPLYPEAVLVVVRRESGIVGLAELEGRRVALGPPGSGMRVNAETLMRHYRIDAGWLEATDDYFMQLLEDPTLDAAVVTTGVFNPDLRRLLGTGRFALLPIRDAEALAVLHPFFVRVEIPRGLFHERPSVPRDPVETIATTAFLAARRDVSPRLVKRTLDALYENDLRAHIPTLMTRNEAASWALVPLHEASRGYHNPYEGLDLFAAMMESIAAGKELLFALGAGLYLLWDRSRRAREKHREAELRTQKDALEALLARTVSIERAQMETTDVAELERYLDEVTRVKLEALEELTDDDLRGDRLFQIFLMQCANLIRKIQSKLEIVSREDLDHGRASGAD